MKICEIYEAGTQNVFKRIKAQCGPYLQEIGGLKNALVNYPMYRGVGTRWVDEDPIMPLNVYPNRPPRDTARILHDLADEWFNDHAGHRFRSDALFATGNSTTAEMYAGTGTVVIVIPCGTYQYCWSEKYWDMTTEIDNFVRPDDEMGDSQLIDAFLGDGQYMLNAGLKDAVKSGHEIMVACKTAIGLPLEWVESISH